MATPRSGIRKPLIWRLRQWAFRMWKLLRTPIPADRLTAFYRASDAEAQPGRMRPGRKPTQHPRLAPVRALLAVSLRSPAPASCSMSARRRARTATSPAPKRLTSFVRRRALRRWRQHAAHDGPAERSQPDRRFDTGSESLGTSRQACHDRAVLHGDVVLFRRIPVQAV